MLRKSTTRRFKIKTANYKSTRFAPGSYEYIVNGVRFELNKVELWDGTHWQLTDDLGGGDVYETKKEAIADMLRLS